MTERPGIGNAVTKIVAVICTIRQVERLGKQSQIHAIAELDVLGQTHIEFKEWIAKKRIELRDGASLRDAINTVEAVLRSGVIPCKSEIVRRSAGGSHDGSRCASPSI